MKKREHEEKSGGKRKHSAGMGLGLRMQGKNQIHFTVVKQSKRNITTKRNQHKIRCNEKHREYYRKPMVPRINTYQPPFLQRQGRQEGKQDTANSHGQPVEGALTNGQPARGTGPKAMAAESETSLRGKLSTQRSPKPRKAAQSLCCIPSSSRPKRAHHLTSRFCSGLMDEGTGAHVE